MDIKDLIDCTVTFKILLTSGARSLSMTVTGSTAGGEAALTAQPGSMGGAAAIKSLPGLTGGAAAVE